MSDMDRWMLWDRMADVLTENVSLVGSSCSVPHNSDSLQATVSSATEPAAWKSFPWICRTRLASGQPDPGQILAWSKKLVDFGTFIVQTRIHGHTHLGRSNPYPSESGKFWTNFRWEIFRSSFDLKSAVFNVFFLSLSLLICLFFILLFL